jgi:hypothetical protein
MWHRHWPTPIIISKLHIQSKDRYPVHHLALQGRHKSWRRQNAIKTPEITKQTECKPENSVYIGSWQSVRQCLFCARHLGFTVRHVMDYSSKNLWFVPDMLSGSNRLVPDKSVWCLTMSLFTPLFSGLRMWCRMAQSEIKMSRSGFLSQRKDGHAELPKQKYARRNWSN